jgi:hypothetical protein
VTHRLERRTDLQILLHRLVHILRLLLHFLLLHYLLLHFLLYEFQCLLFLTADAHLLTQTPHRLPCFI